MQIARCVDGLIPEVHWALRIEHHSASLLGQNSDHPFCDAVLVLRMWQAWLECNTSDSEDASERFVVVFPTSIVTLQVQNVV